MDIDSKMYADQASYIDFCIHALRTICKCPRCPACSDLACSLLEEGEKLVPQDTPFAAKDTGFDGSGGVPTS